MIYISHRGNTKGRTDKENHPDQILEALSQGFDVEMDVWLIDGNICLGHDFPEHEVKIDFLINSRFWCHAKNIVALEEMLKHGIHCFWHQEDDVVLTSNNFLWTYPCRQLTQRSIAVMPS